MNNKGFTLIELIIVIAILSILAFLSAPNVIKLINKNKADNYNGMIDSIIESSKLYVSDNRYNRDKLNFKDDFGNNDFCTLEDNKEIYASITLADLINNKNITPPVENPCTKTNVPEDTIIKITLSCKTKQFSYSVDGLEKITNCNDLK